MKPSLKKRAIAVITALATSFVLFACGGSYKKPSPSPMPGQPGPYSSPMH